MGSVSEGWERFWREPRRIPTTLGVGFAVVIILTVGAAIRAVSLVRESALQRESIFREYADSTIGAERLRSAIENMVAAGRGHLLVGTASSLSRLAEADERLEVERTALRPLVKSAQGDALLSEIARRAAEYRRVMRPLLEARTTAARDEPIAAAFERDVVPRRRGLDQAVDGFVSFKRDRLEHAYREGAQLQRDATTGAIIALIGGGLASLLLAAFLTSTVGRSYRREHDSACRAHQALLQRDEVLGVVAHDLRNPLSAIVMKAASIGRTAAEPRTRQQAESIEKIGLRMERLIRSLLDTAALDMGALSVDPQPCATADLVSDALDIHASGAAEKGVRIETTVAEPESRAMVDRDRVLQVLGNLIGNAVKFTPAGGSILVDAHREGELLRVSVSDSGPGVPSEDLPHVFERLWKAERDGKRGTGLGLYIAKGIVEAHGGHIRAETRGSGGATFSFTVPVGAAP